MRNRKQQLTMLGEGDALFIPLRREYFEAFESGEKTEEYRPYGPRWNERTCRIGRRVVISLGYGTLRRLTGTITGFRQSEEVTASYTWKACYGAAGHKVAACIGIALDSRQGDRVRLRCCVCGEVTTVITSAEDPLGTAEIRGTACPKCDHGGWDAPTYHREDGAEIRGQD